jgi:anti-anti-sigma factor
MVRPVQMPGVDCRWLAMRERPYLEHFAKGKPMQLSFSQRDGVTTVAIAGRITFSTLEPGQDPLTAQEPGIYSRPVAFDLSGTDYIDSTGVSWLLTCQKRCREAGGKLVLHSVTPLVKQVLGVLKLDRVLHLAENAEKARAQLNEVTA